MSIFVWFNKTKIILNNNNFVKIYIDFERSDLIKNINFRVEKMFKEGAVKEVKSFLKLKVPKNNSANKVIGIKEISNYINNKSNLAEAKELIAIKTRQYAKRQTTWARGQMTNWQKIDPNNLNTVIKKL